MMTQAKRKLGLPAQRGNGARGVALILVLMVAVVILLLVGSLLDVLAMEAHGVASSAESSAALTSAYSGVDAQVVAIEEFYVHGVGGGQPPDAGTTVFPNESGGQSQTGYTASITNTYFDTTAGLRYFLIDSTGFVRDVSSGQTLLARKVSALVEESTFSQYSQFTEAEKSNTGGKVWYTNGQQFSGLVYSGGPMYIMYTPGASPPIFGAGFNTLAPPKWYNATTQQFTGVPTGSGYSAVFGPGQSFQTGVQADLPGLGQNLVVFSESYWGDNTHTALSDLQNVSSLPSGVYLNGSPPTGNNGTPLTTGVFVQGDAAVSAVAVGNTETFTFTGTPSDPTFPQTTVSVNFDTNQTTINETGFPSTQYNGVASGEPTGQSSLANGSIFVNGSLTIAGGSSIHGQYTVALPDPPTNGQKMTVTGSVNYQTKPDPQNNITSTDELALWANDIVLNDTNSGDIEIDGMILTGFLQECTVGKCADGAFFNKYCNAGGCGGGVGDITLFGGLIENIRGKLGELGPNGQDLIGGFRRAAVYDARLGANPPPFTPTTNQYNIIALTDDGSL